MNNKSVTLEILVNGKPITEYTSPLNKQQYIEGRDGTDFEIKVTNYSLTDVEAIISVDGLSIIDGKPAGTNSSGYLIKRLDSITIPGWKVNGNTAAKFTFSGKKGNSYVERIGEDSANKGVIGIKVFSQKSKPVPRPYTKGFIWHQADYTQPWSGNLGCSVSNNLSVNSSANNTTSLRSSGSLGTGFGESTSFNTVNVEFERGKQLTTMALYYDDITGLKKVGIDVKKKMDIPNPFPQDETGCKIPEGW